MEHPVACPWCKIVLKAGLLDKPRPRSYVHICGAEFTVEVDGSITMTRHPV